jgi:hypothetical protein
VAGVAAAPLLGLAALAAGRLDPIVFGAATASGQAPPGEPAGQVAVVGGDPYIGAGGVDAI